MALALIVAAVFVYVEVICPSGMLHVTAVRFLLDARSGRWGGGR